MKTYDSSALARQVAAKLKLSPDEESALHGALSRLPNGPVKDALAALTEPSAMRKYIAVIKENCVRDAQYAVTEDAEPLDDEAWMDANDACLYLGTVKAETEIRARQIAAAKEGVDDSVIRVYPCED